MVALGSPVGPAGGKVLTEPAVEVGDERTIIVGEGMTASVDVDPGVGEDSWIIVGEAITTLVDDGALTAVAVAGWVGAAGLALTAVGVKVNVDVAVTAFIAVGVNVKVGVVAAGVMLGETVTVGEP